MLQPAESSWIEPYVVALYRPTVQLATLLVRDYTVAQDIVQEAFVRVWLSPRTPREMSALRPWLYKTVVNLARDHQRRQGRWARLRFGRAASEDPIDVAEGRETDAVLGHATTRRVAMPLGSHGHARHGCRSLLCGRCSRPLSSWLRWLCGWRAAAERANPKPA